MDKHAETPAELAQREYDEEMKTRADELESAGEFVVVAPYVTLKHRDAGGQFVIGGFNEGAVVEKDNVEPDNLRHHVETGLLRAKDSTAAKYAGPAGTPKPGEPPNVPVTEQPVVSLPLDERQRRQAAADAEKPRPGPRSRRDS